MRKHHITILCLVVWCCSFSQQYSNYTTKDGLPSNHVYTIVQDVYGFMWFLTDKGISKYDGDSFKNFTTKDGLPKNDIWEAFPTPDGKLWYISKSSSLGYIENDRVYSFPNANTGEIMSPNYTAQVGNTIYPIGSTKSYQLKNEQWVEDKRLGSNESNYQPIIHPTVKAIVTDFESGQVVLTDKEHKEIMRYPTSLIAYDNGAKGQLNDSIYSSVVEKAYVLLNLNTLQINTFPKEPSKILSPYARVNLVHNNIQYTDDQQVVMLDQKLDVKRVFYYPKDLEGHFGFIDKQDNIWIASFNKGIYKFSKNNQEITTLLQNKKIQNFSEVDSVLIAGIYKEGFYNYNAQDKSFSKIIPDSDFTYGVSTLPTIKTTLYSSKNNLLVQKENTSNSVNFSDIDFSFVTNEVGRKFVYFDNHIFGLNSFGLTKIDPITLKIKRYFRAYGCNDILVMNGQLYLATNNGLKSLIDGELQEISVDNTSFTQPILSIKKISTTHLLVNTDGFGAYITDFNTIHQLKGSEFTIVEDAYIENTSSLWLATNEGILQYQLQGDTYTLSRKLTTQSGLPTNSINTIYVNNEDIIAGTNDGVAMLPKNTIVPSKALDLYYKTASYDTQKIYHNASYDYVSSNTVTFDIGIIDYRDNSISTTLNYKMEPVQNNWLQTNQTTLSYNNLAPGDYVFSVQYQDLEKNTYFTIRPLWYQKNSAKVLLGIAALSIIVLITWFILKSLQKRREQSILQEKQLSELQLKALRSQMNPHFVFNSLSAIQYYINENDYKVSDGYLVKFSRLIRQFFELSKVNEITLDEEIELLTGYLDIEKLRFGEKLNFKFNIDPVISTKSLKIPTMLLQPLVENAVNHGIFNKRQSGIVTTHFKFVNEDEFIVTITDDGVGYINTIKKKKVYNSSQVLSDRIKFLNKSKRWNITVHHEEVYPSKEDKGNKTTLTIKKLA